jgi:hypothetical protein
MHFSSIIVYNKLKQVSYETTNEAKDPVPAPNKGPETRSATLLQYY